jgi:hypothetical protein
MIALSTGGISLIYSNDVDLTSALDSVLHRQKPENQVAICYNSFIYSEIDFMHRCDFCTFFFHPEQVGFLV